MRPRGVAQEALNARRQSATICVCVSHVSGQPASSSPLLLADITTLTNRSGAQGGPRPSKRAEPFVLLVEDEPAGSPGVDGLELPLGQAAEQTARETRPVRLSCWGNSDKGNWAHLDLWPR